LALLLLRFYAVRGSRRELLKPEAESAGGRRPDASVYVATWHKKHEAYVQTVVGGRLTRIPARRSARRSVGRGNL